MQAATANGIDAYLFDLARRASMQQREIESITRSLRTLGDRLNGFFPGELSSHFIFGSADRGTMLPRSVDDDSDVDYMIVWRDKGFRPQTYLDRLKRFVENSYSQSEVWQSSPTIVLELNHIKFDLVPALYPSTNLVIPSGPDSWRPTDPIGFSTRLDQIDGARNGLIRPTIKIAKTWNAKAGRVFESFDLEQRVAAMNFAPRGGLRDYVVTALAGLSTVRHGEQWRQMAASRMLDTLSAAVGYESKFYGVTAAQKMASLFE
jgi:Second Messenger Oligonucleotide or Dinucleotide Synthetase domain